MENKPTFECHPPVEKVIHKIKEIINVEPSNPSLFIESTPNSILSSTNKKLKFGLYTSFYNSERFIDTIFTKIENLNYENFEWHITDDFSSDTTKTKLIERLSISNAKSKIKFYEQTEKKRNVLETKQIF